jgi:hypothetical protein
VSSDRIALATTDGDVRFRARNETFDDGLAAPALGGGIVMIEVTGVPAGLPAGTVVALVLDRLMIRLFPYQL